MYLHILKVFICNTFTDRKEGCLPPSLDFHNKASDSYDFSTREIGMTLVFPLIQKNVPVALHLKSE